MQRLYNGITIPDEWPPRTGSHLNNQVMRVPYLEQPPDVIPIDVGRQLFVDDFLIEKTTMSRRYYHPEKHTGNPVFSPQTALECDPPTLPATIPKCGGIWYDPRDRIFKMWYQAGFFKTMAYATSNDGIHWARPRPGLRFQNVSSKKN